MICRWVQELLGYQFSIIHRHKCMIADVDALTCRFGSLIATHLCIAAILHKRDKYLRSLVYKSITFKSCATSKLTLPHMKLPENPILSATTMAAFSTNVHDEPVPPKAHTIHTSPVMFIHSSPSIQDTPPLHNSHKEPDMKITAVVQSLWSERWCLNNYFGSFLHWSFNYHHPTSCQWSLNYFCTSKTGK